MTNSDWETNQEQNNRLPSCLDINSDEAFFDIMQKYLTNKTTQNCPITISKQNKTYSTYLTELFISKLSLLCCIKTHLRISR